MPWPRPLANPLHSSLIKTNWRKPMIWKLFSSHDLLPHGFCYQWKPALIWLHAMADILIALAYFLIPLALIYFVRRRRDLPFSWMFVCFGVFIAACGATHVMEVWTLWVPAYWLAGGVKAITAIASVPTALFLVNLMPKLLSLPSPHEMTAANEELSRRAAALSKTEERFRQMADNIQEIFWILDPQTKEVSYVSPAFEQICELPLDSLYSNPTSYRELIHPQDRPRVLAELEKLESTNRFDEEFRIVCPSGAVKWIRAIGFTAKDPAGTVTTLVGTAQEITARKELEIVTRESEDRYRDLVEHSTDLICTHDLEGRLLSVNELPAKLLGYPREELLNKPMRDFLLPDARAQFDQSLLDIQKHGFVKGLMVVLTKTGERRIWEYHNTLRTDGVTAPVVRGIAHDITDQRRVEKALRLSEEKFSKAFRCSPTILWISTLQEGRVLEVNEAFERHSGYTRDEIVGHTKLELGLWFDLRERETLTDIVRRQGNARDQEVRFRTKSGQVVVILLSVESVELHGQQCLLTVGQDITERKRAEEELRHLSGQLLRLQDEERRRIARDLHDSTGQDLVALATMLGQLRASIPSREQKSRKLLSECKALADQCIREVRTLSYLLHPPILDEAGLADAIRDYVKGFTKRSGIQVELELSPRLGRMTRDVELALFRVVQESLTNIHRHSGSPQAKIRIDCNSNLTLEISDLGLGASASATGGKEEHRLDVGVGIPSMQERVKLIGGRLHVDFGADGTTVHVTIPLGGERT
jgi:PAS domain S-box-containing protein